MVSRRVWLAGVGAALIGPYLAFDGNLPDVLRSGRDQLFGQSSAFGDATGQPDGSAISPSSWSETGTATNDFNAPTVPLQEALRYDASPEWVVARWPRVATVVGELEWSGMRVPLITGSEPHDLVGSLTYYFDTERRLRRISLEGYTGDERSLVALATQGYGLQPEPSLTGGLYASRWNREAISVLAVQFAPVVDANTPQRRHVMLEINRPDAGWRLSPHMRALVAAR